MRIPPATIMMIYFGGKNCAADAEAWVMSRCARPLPISIRYVLCPPPTPHTRKHRHRRCCCCGFFHSRPRKRYEFHWTIGERKGGRETRKRGKSLGFGPPDNGGPLFIYPARDLTRRDLSSRLVAYILNFEKKKRIGEWTRRGMENSKAALYCGVVPFFSSPIYTYICIYIPSGATAAIVLRRNINASAADNRKALFCLSISLGDRYSGEPAAFFLRYYTHSLFRKPRASYYSSV